MTISSTTRKAGPYSGNGTTTEFAFAFKVFDSSELVVVQLDVATGIETILTIDSDYTVALNPDQNSNPGGTIALSAALAIGYTLTITSQVELLQPTDLTNQGGFYPSVITDSLDRSTIQIQQVSEAVDRTLKIAISTPSGVDTTLPAPVSNQIIGWDNTGVALKNFSAYDLATVVAYGTAVADTFTGTGSQTSWTLSYDPANINNLDVSIGGVTQVPGVDYTWTSGTALIFATAPPNGVTILARYMRGLPQGTVDWGSVTGSQFVSASIYINDNALISSAVHVLQGGKYIVAAGKTLTITAPFTAGLYQVFDCSATGASVVFGSGAVSEVYPEWWGSDLAKTFASGAPKITFGAKGTTYTSATALTLSGCELNLNGSTLQFTGTGAVKCLDVRSNSSVYGGTIENAGTSPSGSGDYQCPILVGDYGVGTGYSNINIHDLTVINNRDNGNGIMVTGNSSNVSIRNIVFPASSAIGRPVLIHWGGATTPASGTYHPYNISVDNVAIGNMTNGGASVAGVMLSGAYNISVNNVSITSSQSGYGAYIYPGDYGAQYAGAVANNILKNITISNMSAKSVLVGVYATSKNISGTLATIASSITVAESYFSGYDNTATSCKGVYASNINGITIDRCVLNAFNFNADIIGVCENIRIINNIIMSSYSRAVSFTSNAAYLYKNVSIVDNHFDTNNTQASAGRADVYADYCQQLKIINNSFASPNMSYSVRVINTSVDVYVSGNYVRSILAGGVAYSFGSGTDYGINVYGAGNIAAAGITLIGGTPLRYINGAGLSTIYNVTAAPTAGTWAVGDRAVRSPAVGSPKAWACTVAGTPGTWTSEGNL